PAASRTKRKARCPISKATSPDATSSRPMKRTTPTPSLNSDSPAICTSSVLGAPICLSRLSTATGSVGEINAPNSRQSMNRNGKPSRAKTPHISTPTISVESSTPTVASTAIGQIDVQGPGEEEEREHSVQQRLVEIKELNHGTDLLRDRRVKRLEHEQR